MLQFNEEEIDTDTLIELVKDRPHLYSLQFKDSRNWEVTTRLWQDVAKNMFPDIWDNLMQKEKYQAGSVVRRRWKSIRDCFRRQLREQNRGKVRRKYVFYNKLVFLLPSMDISFTTRPPDELDVTEEIEEVSEMVPQYGKISGKTKKQSGSAISLLAETGVKKETDFEAYDIDCNVNEFALEEMEDITQSSMSQHSEKAGKQNTNSNAETHFLLSLAPKLRALSEETKLEVQIQFLRILKEAYQTSKN